MKLLKRIGIVLLLLIIVSCAGAYVGLQYTKPQLDGALTFSALTGEVEVYFDNFGIPHIYADSEKDAQFALGYVHAQDRLFQMEMMRRLARGELAEILGPELVKSDRFFRTIGVLNHAKKAAAAFEALPESNPMKQAALAYYEGVNAYMDHGSTPLEFQIVGIPKRHFTPEDTYAIFGYMAFSFAQAFKTDPLITRIAQKYGASYLQDLDMHWDSSAQVIPVFGRNARDTQLSPATATATTTATTTTATATTTLPASYSIQDLLDDFLSLPWIGSNSWVLAPEKSKSGKVLFSNDTHMAFSQPSTWYEAHLEYPGASIYGTYLGGVPFSVTGHSRHHAVGLTMLENDDIDFYVEERNPANPNQVKFKEAWEEVQTREERIQVKDAEEVVFNVQTTRHGPIVNEAISDVALTTDQPVAMWWIYNEFLPKNLQAAYQMGRASSMEEVREAVSIGHAPGLNVMYGDSEGNIAWWTMAKLPIRQAHVNSKVFLNGASGEDEILGYVEFVDNPQSENPPTGYVYSANNQPDTTAGILHAGYYIPQDRADKIVETLDQVESWDIEDMKEMINVVQSPIMQQVKQSILDNMKSYQAEDANMEEVLLLLGKWQGDNGLKEVGPTIYTKMLYHIAAECFSDELGEEDFSTWLSTHMFKRTLPFLMNNPDSPWWDNVETDTKESLTNIVHLACEKSVEELSNQLGPDPKSWTWDRVHTIEHPHPLAAVETFRPIFNVGPFPVNGNIETVNNMMFKLEGDGTYEVLAGPAKRRIIDFADVDHAISVLPTGQSGNVMSPHYSDQAQMFVNGEFRQMKMNTGEIQKEGTKLVLSGTK